MNTGYFDFSGGDHLIKKKKKMKREEQEEKDNTVREASNREHPGFWRPRRTLRGTSRLRDTGQKFSRFNRCHDRVPSADFGDFGPLCAASSLRGASARAGEYLPSAFIRALQRYVPSERGEKKRVIRLITARDSLACESHYPAGQLLMHE